jgi:hypothetical protein
MRYTRPRETVVRDRGPPKSADRAMAFPTHTEPRTDPLEPHGHPPTLLASSPFAAIVIYPG